MLPHKAKGERGGVGAATEARLEALMALLLVLHASQTAYSSSH